jgi:hypothetical protein
LTCFEDLAEPNRSCQRVADTIASVRVVGISPFRNILIDGFCRAAIADLAICFAVRPPKVSEIAGSTRPVFVDLGIRQRAIQLYNLERKPRGRGSWFGLALIRRFAEGVAAWSSADGAVGIEIGWRQAATATRLMARGLPDRAVATRRDDADIERFVIAAPSGVR